MQTSGVMASPELHSSGGSSGFSDCFDWPPAPLAYVSILGERNCAGTARCIRKNDPVCTIGSGSRNHVKANGMLMRHVSINWYDQASKIYVTVGSPNDEYNRGHPVPENPSVALFNKSDGLCSTPDYLDPGVVHELRHGDVLQVGTRRFLIEKAHTKPTKPTPAAWPASPQLVRPHVKKPHGAHRELASSALRRSSSASELKQGAELQNGNQGSGQPQKRQQGNQPREHRSPQPETTSRSILMADTSRNSNVLSATQTTTPTRVHLHEPSPTPSSFASSLNTLPLQSCSKTPHPIVTRPIKDEKYTKSCEYSVEETNSGGIEQHQFSSDGDKADTVMALSIEVSKPTSKRPLEVPDVYGVKSTELKKLISGVINSGSAPDIITEEDRAEIEAKRRVKKDTWKNNDVVQAGVIAALNGEVGVKTRSRKRKSSKTPISVNRETKRSRPSDSPKTPQLSRNIFSPVSEVKQQSSKALVRKAFQRDTIKRQTSKDSFDISDKLDLSNNEQKRMKGILMGASVGDDTLNRLVYLLVRHVPKETWFSSRDLMDSIAKSVEFEGPPRKGLSHRITTILKEHEQLVEDHDSYPISFLKK